MTLFLSENQIGVMTALLKGCTTPGEIAKLAKINLSTVYGALSKFRVKRLAEQSEVDGEWSLTPLGERAFNLEEAYAAIERSEDYCFVPETAT